MPAPEWWGFRPSSGVAVQDGPVLSTPESVDAFESSHRGDLRGPTPKGWLRTLLAAVVVLTLTMLVWHHAGPVGVDRSLLRGYSPVKSSLLFRTADVLSTLGSPAVVIAIGIASAVWLWARRRSSIDALACLAAPAIAGFAESAAKMIVARPRPLTAALTGEDGMGFPSGHSAGFAALALILALVLTGVRPAKLAVALSIVLSVLMAMSRVIVGAHYPTDVIAGVVLGLAVADVVWQVSRRLGSGWRPAMLRA